MPGPTSTLAGPPSEGQGGKRRASGVLARSARRLARVRRHGRCWGHGAAASMDQVRRDRRLVHRGHRRPGAAGRPADTAAGPIAWPKCSAPAPTTSPTRTSRSAAGCCSRSRTSRWMPRSNSSRISSRSRPAATTSSAPARTRTTSRARFEAMVERLRSDGATVVMFNGPDVGMTPVLGRVRGKVAIYNENLRADRAAARRDRRRTCGRCASSGTRGCGRPTACTSPRWATT